MTSVLLVRHADAGVRGTWPGDDFARVLSSLGDDQAAQLAERLPAMRDEPIATIASSRAVRCVDTVAPLGTELDVGIVEVDVLLEGADPVATLAWLESDEASDVACSHGDVIGGVVMLLVARGVAPASASWPKGSTWVLEREGSRITAARFERPPSAS